MKNYYIKSGLMSIVLLTSVLTGCEKAVTEDISETAAAITISSEQETETVTTDAVAEFTNVIYGDHFDTIDEEYVAASGACDFSYFLKTAMEENSGNTTALYAVNIEVYDYNEEHRNAADKYLEEYSIEGLTYEDIQNKRSEIWVEIQSSSEAGDIYIHPELTAEQAAEYKNRINKLIDEDQYYYELDMDMLHAREIYALELESKRLEENGINVCGITDNPRNTNYIIALADAEQLNSLPFYDDVGYKVGLTPKEYYK